MYLRSPFLRGFFATLAACGGLVACRPAHHGAASVCEATHGCGGSQPDSATAVRIALETFAAMDLDSASLRVTGFARSAAGGYTITLTPRDSMILGGGGVIVLDRNGRVVSVRPEQ